MNNEMEMLAKADSPTLAQWWCELNTWGWPAELGEPEPENAPAPSRRTVIMTIIGRIIGHKECLREWNKEQKPGKKFDEWYDNRKEIK